MAALGVLLGGLTALPARAQLAYRAADAAASAGTFTSLGTTGTAIVTANTDDATSAPQAIGFSFEYDGQTYTQFTLSTNGFIKLGAVAPSSDALYYTNPQTYDGPSPFESNDAVDVDIISPFNYDLEPGVGTTSYRLATTGTAPNRVTTVQWSNVRDKALAGLNRQLNNISFQVKLYETTGQIQFVYDASTAAPGTAGFRAAGVGLVGRGRRSYSRFLTVAKGSVQPWADAVFQDGGYSEVDPASNRFNFRSSELAVSGLTYSFTSSPVVAVTDAAISGVYTLGTLPIPIGAPHSVQTVVVNNGTTPLTNVAVTLTVTGVSPFTNTQTLPTLAFGDEVVINFPGYTPTTAGMNQISVALGAADDSVANNTVTTDQQVVTTGTYGYADSGPATNSYGLNAPGLWVARYNTTATGLAVQSVGAYIGGGEGSVVYGVVVNAQGAILARSPNYTITAADLDTYHQFAMPTQPLITPGDFYVGMAQVGTMVFPMGTQDETPLRPNTFFIATALTGLAPLQDLATQLPVRLMLEVTLGAPAACVAPATITVGSLTATGATVTISAVAGATGYTVFYGAPGFTPGGAGSQQVTVTGTTATLTGLTATTNYDVYVRTNCSATSFSSNNGPIAFATTCVAPTITLPYTEGFESVVSPNLPCGTSILNVNNDNRTWRVYDADSLNRPAGLRPYAGQNELGYFYNATAAADDWFFLPAITIPAGGANVKFWWASGFAAMTIWEEKLEVKYGATPTPAGMTTSIFNGVIEDTVFRQETTSVIPGGAAPVYIGFHAISDADEFFLNLDEITVDRVTGLNAPALARAVSVYPNPTAGRLSISVTETGATRVALRVLDNLGRVVYTGSMHDNAIKNVELGHLSNALYTVQVTLDDQVVTKQVSVLK